MARSLTAIVIGLAAFFAAPLVNAAPADTRSCALCWETATNQVHNPTCTGIFDEAKLEACLCAAGNKETFELCDYQCKGSPKAPSAICKATANDAVISTRADDQSCALCYEQAAAQAHSPSCNNLAGTELDACLCANGNYEVFSGCNYQCKNTPSKLPSTVCPATDNISVTTISASTFITQATRVPTTTAAGFSMPFAPCSILGLGEDCTIDGYGPQPTAAPKIRDAQISSPFGPCGMPGEACNSVIKSDAAQPTIAAAPKARDAEAQIYSPFGPCGMPGESCNSVVESDTAQPTAAPKARDAEAQIYSPFGPCGMPGESCNSVVESDVAQPTAAPKAREAEAQIYSPFGPCGMPGESCNKPTATLKARETSSPHKAAPGSPFI